MQQFTLFEQPAAGDQEEFLANPLKRSRGDRLVISERVLVDRNGNQRGSFVLIGTYVKIFPGLPNDDVLMSFQASNRITGRGVINTQGAIRFSELATGVTFAIVGGTGEFKKARGTVRVKSPRFTYRVK
jgi:hypothetical protein